MALIDADFDDQSFGSEDSYNHIFACTNTVRPKGLYFQSAQLLREPVASCQYSDPTQQVLINVGGTRYTFPWSTLDDVPHSRLSCLRFCNTLLEIAEICDDYDEMRHEFFFDRDPLAFRAIVNFLAKGKLRVLNEVCNVALHDELLYWGLDITMMESCCRHQVMSSVERVAIHQRKEDEWHQKRRKQMAHTVDANLFHMLGEAVENPQSGLIGKVFAFLSVTMVVVTVVSLCISSMLDPQEEEDTVCINLNPCKPTHENYLVFSLVHMSTCIFLTKNPPL